MKQRTYATQEEISSAVSEIVPKGHSVMGYPRQDQIDVAMEVARRTGKSVRLNAMTIHPDMPISFGEKLYRAFVAVLTVGVILIVGVGILVALAALVAG